MRPKTFTELCAEATKPKKKGGWVKEAFNPAHKGKLHRALGVAENKPIPASKLDKAAQAGGKLGKMANLAKVAKGFKK